MALNENQAAGVAKELMLAMAGSNSLKSLGPLNSSGEEGNIKRGRWDATYLASLYRELVIELQK